jgi:hypothetical protein
LVLLGCLDGDHSDHSNDGDFGSHHAGATMIVAVIFKSGTTTQRSHQRKQDQSFHNIPIELTDQSHQEESNKEDLDNQIGGEEYQLPDMDHDISWFIHQDEFCYSPEVIKYTKPRQHQK